ncbi:hypothetical protein JD844_009845 [Phrynosoma platyrhinos]|uniref:Peptidase M13 C-terminal domain-containing protein n=1 Tax=Phrynosoma platyrhinos TaxID=52577 RepID=A0ABQ7TGE6_PHRPL|nr:hypothetical protein JD844_009845 [Phrynosoma platyrhinos]
MCHYFCHHQEEEKEERTSQCQARDPMSAQPPLPPPCFYSWIFFSFTVLTKNCSSCDMKSLVQGIECLVKQYGSYSLEGHSINGTFTLLENAADTEGLAIAYQVSKLDHLQSPYNT